MDTIKTKKDGKMFHRVIYKKEKTTGCILLIKMTFLQQMSVILY